MALVFELVSPERLVMSREVEMAVIPGAEGDFGVLEGHAPLISTLRPGTIDIHDGGAVAARVFVAGGFSEVAGERCTVLAEEAVDLDDLDPAAAERRAAEAREALAKAEDEPARKRAEAEALVAEAMLAALERGRPQAG